jgi:hypothetical protein
VVAATQADDSELTKTARASKRRENLGAGLESNAPHRNEPLPPRDLEQSFLVVFVVCLPMAYACVYSAKNRRG